VSAEAVRLGPGEGERLEIGPNAVTVKAGGAETGGTLFLGETESAPGFQGPPPHYHERLHDMFYVLEGTLTVRLGDETLEAGPGAFVCVPPGVVHTFSNQGSEPVRFLNFNTPAGWEDYMRDLAAAFEPGAPMSPQAMAEVMAAYDIVVVG
jgi:mannose-6-phosphate isomerase-like protein (cupin superfamily)